MAAVPCQQNFQVYKACQLPWLILSDGIVIYFEKLPGITAKSFAFYQKICVLMGPRILKSCCPPSTSLLHISRSSQSARLGSLCYRATYQLSVLHTVVYIGVGVGVDCHVLLQRIFLTQGSNPGLSCCRWILYHLNHQGSPSGYIWRCYFLCFIPLFPSSNVSIYFLFIWCLHLF